MNNARRWQRVYGVIGTLIVLWYSWSTFQGYELGGDTRDTLSEAARRNPRGANSWITGFRGGK
ncbi:MAG: hypothetical protein U0V87_17350 [Acidobacteriota bacterium]